MLLPVICGACLSLFCAASVLASVVHSSPLDLSIYRDAAETVARGGALYKGRWADGYQFNYPPFAAMLFLLLVPFGLLLDTAVVTTLSGLALLCCLWRAGVLANRRVSVPLLGFGAVLLVVSEPVHYTLSFGQINLFIAALVITDLSLPDGSRFKGALIGLAAGVKLTPLIFIPYLFFTGRRRAAAIAAAVFVLTVLIAFIALPHDASAFWLHGLFLSSKRVGGVASVANQSLRAALLRLSPHLNALALPLCGAVAALGLWVACQAARHGDELLGFAFTALTGLLVSPVSWVHHWALIMPVLPYVILRPGRPRMLGAGLYLLSVSYWLVVVYRVRAVPAPTTPTSQVAADSYVLVALVILGGAAIRLGVKRRSVTFRALALWSKGRRQPRGVGPASLSVEPTNEDGGHRMTSAALDRFDRDLVHASKRLATTPVATVTELSNSILAARHADPSDVQPNADLDVGPQYRPIDWPLPADSQERT